MGKQIQHLLSERDEARLLQHLRAKFPVIVADATYPASWDGKTLGRSADASMWIIVDERTVPIVVATAVRLQTAEPKERAGWQIRSSAFSCVEWSRGPVHGRLYLNTTPHPVWAEISAATGDDIERMYERACRWIRANCIDCGESRRSYWVSRERVAEYRRARRDREAQRRAQPRDPRDARFYELRRKPKKSLTAEDRAALVRYCDAMLEYLTDDVASASWREYRVELVGQLRHVAKNRDLVISKRDQKK